MAGACSGSGGSELGGPGSGDGGSPGAADRTPPRDPGDGGGPADGDPTDPRDGGLGDENPDGGRPEDGGGSDGGVSRDGGSFENPLCLANGDGSRTFGEDCGCNADCAADAPRCARNLLVDLEGPSYCTIDCPQSGCPAGYACLEGFGPVEPFCQRCASPEPGGLELGQSCVCDRDCGSMQIDGGQTGLVCRDGLCAVTQCVPVIDRGCPEDHACELRGAETVCIACIAESPRDDGEACGCRRDCASGLVCAEGTCRTPCEGDEDCGPDEACDVPLVGEGLCAPEPEDCDADGGAGLGDLCSCNADCASDAPVCVRQSLSSSVAVGFCTVRPCDRRESDPCGDPAFSCCEVPLLFEPTCLDSRLTEPLGDLLLCSP